MDYGECSDVCPVTCNDDDEQKCDRPLTACLAGCSCPNGIHFIQLLGKDSVLPKIVLTISHVVEDFLYRTNRWFIMS